MNSTLYHVHFGFDALSPEQLKDIVAALRAHRKPLVYTVHDLRNPHHADGRAHDAALDVLVPAADALITLSSGAAHEITRRWRRPVTVIPHPHVVARRLLNRPRPTRQRRQVGIHLKSLRANLNPLPVLEVLLAQAPKRNIHVVVDVHTDVINPRSRNHNREVTRYLRGIAGVPGVRVRVHKFFTDDELWDYFMSLDMSVLPYRFGTHSGWLEACFDLGTRVLAPRVGHYHEQQHGVFGYRLNAAGDPRESDIAGALDGLADEREWRAEPARRIVQRREIADAHRRIYSRLLANVPA